MSLMTLDEAIQHCRDKENCSQCGQEHKRLREWLEELKDLRTRYNIPTPHGRLIDADKVLSEIREIVKADSERGKITFAVDIFRPIKKRSDHHRSGGIIMAALDGLVTFTQSEYRLCTVDGRKALFHRWHEFCNVVEASPMIGGAPAGQIKYTLGTVEYEDGTIEEVAPHRIVFSDRRVVEEWRLNEEGT